MKRMLLVALAMCLCVSLVACAATDPDNLFGTVENNEMFAPGVVSENETYQYGNMQKSPGGEFLRLGNDVLFTSVVDNGFKLYSYDLSSGTVRLFCDDATCKHSNCLAGSILWGLEVHEGKLYAINRSHQAAVMEDGELKPITKGQVGGFFHHDGKMYILSAADRSLVVMEEGSDTVRTIVEEYTGNWNVIFGNYLYATSFADNIIRVDLTADVPVEEVLVANACGMTDGQHIYYADRKTWHLYRCDMDGSNVKLILDKPVLPASWNFDDEYFYYRLYTDRKLNKGEDCYDLYRFPKSDPTKIEKFATLPVPAYQVYTVPGTDSLFVTAYVRSDGENNDIYVVKRDGTNITRLEIPEY